MTTEELKINIAALERALAALDQRSAVVTVVVTALDAERWSFAANIAIGRAAVCAALDGCREMLAAGRPSV